jgi:hypothetical protein
MFEMEALSHADNDFDIHSLFVENVVQRNRQPGELSMRQMKENNNNFIDSRSYIYNSPSSYVIALRGIQNCTFFRNTFNNDEFGFELVGALVSNTLNTTIDAQFNWWGTANSSLIKHRIFDIHQWNNHARVNFVPFYSNNVDFSVSRLQPIMNYDGEHILGGLVTRDLHLKPIQFYPYQVKLNNFWYIF